MDSFQIHAMRIEDRLKMLLDSATVTESGCMEVDIACSRDGYPMMKSDGRMQNVSRLLMPFLMQNPVDITGLVVRHTCDNPRCINPEHLLLGTRSDNSQDILARPNGHRGIRLTWEQVREIRRLYATGQYTQIEVASMFGMSRSTVMMIVNNRQWKEQ